MSKTINLGRRVELHSMDKFCGNISIGLYRREFEGNSEFLVHTYSMGEATFIRVAFIRDALMVMLGMKGMADADRPHFRFDCGCPHLRPLKRAFLDLCKLETGAALCPKPMIAYDKKAEGEIYVEGRGNGVYEISPQAGLQKGARRAVAVAKGFCKLCEMEMDEESAPRIVFPCGMDHDEIIGMLMFRAQNVRAAMQEEEIASTRGVLTSPSQQK